MGCGTFDDLNPFHSDREEKWLGTNLSDDITDAVGDVGTFVWNEGIEPIGDFSIDLLADFTELNLDVIDFVLEPFGITGATQFLRDLNEGARYLGHGILDGNWDAVRAGVMIAVAIVITIYTWNPYALANAVGSVIALSQAAAYTLIAIGYAASIYTIYGIAVSVAAIGEAVRNGAMMDLLAVMQKTKDAMNLSFVNAFINGSMNLWRAGGILYDSPRAGDLQFNVTGSLNTTQFLGMQNMNNNTWSQWERGSYHNFQSKTFGSMAGDMFFGIKPITQ